MRCAQCGHEWATSGEMKLPPAAPVWPAAVEIPAPASAPPASFALPSVAPASVAPTEPGAWPAPGARNVFEETPRVSGAGFEPAAPTTTSTAAWPSPADAEPQPERNPFVYEGPSSTADIIASLARKPAPGEEDDERPAETPEANNNNAFPGNEERFAALVKSSRTAGSEDIRAGRAGLFTTVLLLVAVCGGLWAYRDQVVHAVPATAPIFNGVNNLLGIHPAPPPAPPATPTAPK